jgi:hypothetical protein
MSTNQQNVATNVAAQHKMEGSNMLVGNEVASAGDLPNTKQEENAGKQSKK